ncbi:MAG: TetR/AcrR family transcriptional regulator [Cyanobacteriota bacterium]|nr:TetR/AcrR family transcriptional regulator [Cyanobacteriota bacterium]
MNNRSTNPKSADRLSKGRSDKAEAILAGALQVFTTYGYAAASMDRIAAAAGVSKPTLYSYFQDKEGLFVALIEQLTQNKTQILFALQSAPDLQAPPETVLRHMATSVLTEFSQNKSLLTLMRLIIGESERFPELARTFVREIQKPLLGGLAGYLGSHPQLQLPDPMVAARIFAGSLVHYLIIQNVMHGSDIVPLERDRMIDGLIHLLTTAGKLV